MAFFHNRTVNLVNLHYVIGSVALGGGGAAELVDAARTQPEEAMNI